MGSFVLDEGTGPAVLCMHDVPASSFLYRKLVTELAGRGMRGFAFDLPGLGLAERAGGLRLHLIALGPVQCGSRGRIGS
ncbi:MAG: hypothetical protein M3Y33_02580 [Actinomycetota bacterium]|nr:hypothetical protein [Actinomycetota bacterium]